MSWLIYSLLLILLSWFVLRKLSSENLNQWDYLIAFWVKIGFGVSYIIIFTYYFSDGTKIYGDTYRFLSDSQIINKIVYQDPIVFLKLVFGLGDLNTEEIQLYLNQTQIWDYGNNGDWINDNRLILRLNIIIHFFSLNNIYIHALIFSFISFSGIHLIYKAFAPFISRRKLFWYTLILWPGIGFWGSGILKESILVFGIGLWFYAIFKLLHQRYKTQHLILLIVGGLTLIFNKPYAGLFIIFSTLIYIIGYLTNWRKIGFIFSGAGLLISLIIVFNAPDNTNLTKKIAYKQNALDNLGKGGITFITDSSFCVFPYEKIENFSLIGKDHIKINQSTDGSYKLFGKNEFKDFKLNPSSQIYEVYLVYPPSNSYFKTTKIDHVRTLLKTIPEALVNVMIRPYPWDNGDRFKFINFIFNIILIGLFCFALYFRSQINKQTVYLLVTLFLTALFIAIIIGLTIPIFGALVRYKLPVELCLILISFILLKPKYENHSTL